MGGRDSHGLAGIAASRAHPRSRPAPSRAVVGHPILYLNESRWTGVTVNRFCAWACESTLMSTYSDEELLAAIDQLAEKHGRAPTLQELRTETKYSGRVFFSRFGSWRDALEAAGYDSRPPQEAISKRDLVEELRRLGDDLDKRPTFREMDAEGAYDPTTYIREFGSWNAALEAADFDPPSTLTKDALRTELQRLADELDKRPSQRDMNKHGNHSHTTYIRHFGSWSEALNAAFDDEKFDDE